MKKDKEWLKKKIKGFQEGENMFTSEFNAGVQQSLEYAQELIDQLDEPEVLSQEWVDENVVEGDFRGEQEFWYGRFVEEEKVRNLLVPKQDKPVIPKFVADWIEKQMKFGYEDVFISMTRLRERAPEKVKFWFRNNSDTYARSWLDVYEVEKEKVYIIKFAPSIYGTPTYGAIGTQSGKKIMQSIYGSPGVVVTPNQYTEEEIKEVGSKYMAFAEEVTE